MLYGDNDLKSLSKSYFLSHVLNRSSVIGNGLNPPSNINNNILLSDIADGKLSTHNYFISIGRMYNNRFFDIIAPVMQWLSTHPYVYWVVVGDGENFSEFVDIVNCYKHKHQVIILGSIEDDDSQMTLISNARYVLHSGTVGLHVLNSYRFGKRILIPSDCSMYSIEANLCYEPYDLRYNQLNISSLLDEFFENYHKSSIMDQITFKNNTLTMANNLSFALSKIPLL